MNEQLVQTVYIPDKDRVHISEFDVITHPAYRLQGQKGIFFTVEEYNAKIKEVIEETLKNGAEKAYTKDIGEVNAEGSYEEYHIIDKDSILNTFEESYKKFKI
jgi:hypothetical protein